MLIAGRIVQKSFGFSYISDCVPATRFEILCRLIPLEVNALTVGRDIS